MQPGLTQRAVPAAELRRSLLRGTSLLATGWLVSITLGLVCLGGSFPGMAAGGLLATWGLVLLARGSHDNRVAQARFTIAGAVAALGTLAAVAGVGVALVGGRPPAVLDALVLVALPASAIVLCAAMDAVFRSAHERPARQLALQWRRSLAALLGASVVVVLLWVLSRLGGPGRGSFWHDLFGRHLATPLAAVGLLLMAAAVVVAVVSLALSVQATRRWAQRAACRRGGSEVGKVESSPRERGGVHASQLGDGPAAPSRTT